ncbi:MAG: hypothetical protein N2235_01550 [Fischerella sp.]|nr:hypothetical protein [Fischerella sp.]
MIQINEGGNVFKNADGTPATQRINRADVDPTIMWLESVTNLDLLGNKLGTTGIKDSSGDLDIAVDPSVISKDQLVQILSQWVIASGEDPKEWIRKSGDSVHFKTPIRGRTKLGFVQTDFMFGEPQWMKFAMHGGSTESNYKGVDRQILLASIAKANGLKWSYKAGLTSRTTGDLISKDPDRIAEILLGPGSTAKDTHTVEGILAKIKHLPNYNELVADAKEQLAAAGRPLPESIQEGTAVWFKKMQSILVK